MALLFIDGFDHYATADLPKKWSSYSIYASVLPTGGRRGTGSLRGTGNPAWVKKTVVPGASFVMGFAFRAEAIPPSAVVIASWQDAASVQCDLRLNPDGTFSVTRNGTAVTSGTSTYALPTNTWSYIEWKVTVADSIAAGSCVVRVNGAVVITVAAGQDLKSTANATANGFQIGTHSTSVSVDIDDLYVCDLSGATNNDFLGDCRVDSVFPNGDGTYQEMPTLIQKAGVDILTTGAGTSSYSANQKVALKTTAASSFQVTAGRINFQTTANAAKVKMVIYADSAGSPGGLLGTSDEVVGVAPSVWTTFTFSTPVALTGGSSYWIGFISDTALAVWNTGPGSIIAGNNDTYSDGAAGTFGSSTPGTTGWGITVSGPQTGGGRYVLVNEVAPDQLSRAASNTVGHRETYQMQDLANVTGTIYGVQVNVAVAKDDAGSRTVAPMVRSGATDAVGPDLGLSTSQLYALALWEKNPNGNIVWTEAAVNALEAGVKVTG